MALSQTALQGILAQATEQVFLECLTITHSEFTTIRLVNDTQDLTRSAGTYSKFPFQIRAAAGTSEKPPALEITADMVDQRLMTAVRTIAGKRERPQIVYEVVLASSPDTVEYGPAEFRFDSAQSDGMTRISIRASFLLGALNDAFPALQFAPSNASE